MSEKKSNASRINGAKSHGPVSDEGKQRSSHNATKHGLCSRRLLLPDESPQELDELTVYWMRQLQPLTPIERELAADVIAAAWIMRRYERAETSLLTIEMEKYPGDPDAIGRAIKSLSAESRALELMHRYRGRARREFQQARKAYKEEIERRREEQDRDRENLSSRKYRIKWGLRPAEHSPAYCGSSTDTLPNEPDSPAVFTPLFAMTSESPGDGRPGPFSGNSQLRKV